MKIDHSALIDPAHPAHHFSLGQFFALALLGLAAYSQQNQPGGGSGVFLNPQTTAAYLQGVLSILQQNPPTP